MNRRRFLSSSVAIPLAAQAPQRRRPNIVLILADDLGYGDLGCYGQKVITTPRIDQLASEGLRFTQAYAGCTVCAPSRCALMTGRHTGHCLVRGNFYPDLPLRKTDITLTEVLKQAGYRTGLFGKWSLGGLGTSGYPLDKGFDEFVGFFSQTHAHNYYPEHLLENRGSLLLRGNMGTQKKEYAPDIFTDRAVRFVEAAARNRQQPFFLHLSHPAPHANNELGRDTGNGMEVPEDAPYSSRPWPKPEKNFAAMVTRLDRDVGRVLDRLKQLGLDEDTLVIFTSDNGPHREGGHDAAFFSSSGALTGTKRDLTEGGIRVPFIARWAGTIQPGVSDHVVAFWDLLPTFAELAGAPAPRDVDGISIAGALRGAPARSHEYLYWEFHEGRFQQAIRMGAWKAIRNRGRTALYDLARDVGESDDVSARHPDVLARIEPLFAQARTESMHWPVKPGEGPPERR
ncbi:MAG: arylsulfatase [Acidobacteria bacterium]|nr:arylsulfatase [Acidobacteriota bacterium]